MYEQASSSTSRSSRSSSPETPASSSEAPPLAFRQDAFSILNDSSTWSSRDQQITDNKSSIDFNSWTTLGDDLVSLHQETATAHPFNNLSSNVSYIPEPMFDSQSASIQTPVNFFAPDLPVGFDLTPPDGFVQSSDSYPQCLSSSLTYPPLSQPNAASTVVSGNRQQNPEPEARVVTPAKDACSNLAIQFPNVPLTGAKSRVETQIRVVLELVNRPSPSDQSTTTPFESYDRVGSWKCIRLPPGSSTRRRPRKDAKIEADADDTLYLSTEITCASPPHLPVAACSSCQNREAKRTARKLAARVRPARSDEEESAPLPPALQIKTEEGDDTGIVQFNCPDTVAFDSGSVILPVRVTCYCRHHREKVGFNLKFFLRDHQGRCIGVGTTPPIMITDDHKTPCKTANSSDAEAETPVTFTHLSSQRGTTAELKPKRKRKPKPYDGVRPNGVATARSSPAPPSSTQTAQYQGYGLPSPPITASDSNAPSPSASSSDVLSTLDPLTASLLQTLDNANMSPTASTAQIQLPTAPPSPERQFTQSLATVTPYSVLPSSEATGVPTPKILRLIPSSGPTHGGIEVTILGSNFNSVPNLTAVFGECRAMSSSKWSDNALVCILPARPTPGIVAVTFEGIRLEAETGTPALFTYMEESDRALMELALQVVGMRMTGKMEDAKNVAMRIVGAAGDANGTNSALDVSDIMQFSYGISGMRDLEGLVEKFLGLLDVAPPSPVSTEEALAQRSRSGHTLLHLAVHMKLKSVVSSLITRGADIDARDRNGFTALHFAAIAAWQEGIDLLLDSGADLEVVDAMGRTAEECSADSNLDFSSRRRMNERTVLGMSDDDAEADVEDEVDGPRNVRSARVSRRSSRTSLRINLGVCTPSRRTSSPTRLSAALEKHSTPPIKSEEPDNADDKKPAVDSKTDPVVAARELMNWLRGTIATIQAGNVPAVPWPLPQLNHLPPFANLPMPQLPQLPHLPQLPDMPALPQIPMVFPVYVPIPSWPLLPWPQAQVDNKEAEAGDGNITKEEVAKQDVASAWRVSWEKWTAQWTQAMAQNQPPPLASDPPPIYSESPPNTPAYTDSKREGSSPAASTSVAQVHPQESQIIRKRSGSQHGTVSKREANAFAYRPQTKSRKDNGDRMLLWFWLPTLILGFIWGIVTSIPLAFGILSDMFPLGNNIRS